MLYYRMQASGVIPDAHIHVAILKACTNTQALVAGKLIHFDIVELYVEPSLFIWSTLVDMYSKCGSMRDAQCVFDKLEKRNIVIWSAMISGYVKHGYGEEALCLYNVMLLEGFDPDLVTAVSVLKACSGTGNLQAGNLIHAQIVDSGLVMDVTLGNSLLNMYARCSSLGEAWHMFKILRKRDIVTWSSMVDSYVEHKDHSLALGFFELMLEEKMKPDEVAFLCLLSACSQMGLVGNGCYHFNTLVGIFGALPRLDHFNCMVDLLGRAGHLFEAEDLLKTMPFRDNVVGWRCFLSHTRMYDEMGSSFHADSIPSDFKDELRRHIIFLKSNANSGTVTTKVDLKESGTFGSLSETATITYNRLTYSFTAVTEAQSDNGLWDKLNCLSVKLKEGGYLPIF
ncbi:hypothetical protein KP509_11G066400 [Ceratopteris richardii]|nr:hypothetical protein KP509_11G066400 [Ceratopteris richardii]